jgi:hypothetical protein
MLQAVQQQEQQQQSASSSEWGHSYSALFLVLKHLVSVVPTASLR